MSKGSNFEGVRTGVINPPLTMRSYGKAIYKEIKELSTGRKYKLYLWKCETGATMWSSYKPDKVVGHEWHKVHEVEYD